MDFFLFYPELEVILLYRRDRCDLIRDWSCLLTSIYFCIIIMIYLQEIASERHIEISSEIRKKLREISLAYGVYRLEKRIEKEYIRYIERKLEALNN